MKKKMSEKKFAEEARDWMGYCPFSSLSHDTMDCIVTQIKKMSEKKFSKEAGDWMGYYPFSSLSHDTMDCIVTHGNWGMQQGGHYTARRPYDMALLHGQSGLRHNRPANELKSHLFSVHFSDLFLTKKTDVCAEIWNN